MSRDLSFVRRSRAPACRWGA